jgi:hypothetical protein
MLFSKHLPKPVPFCGFSHSALACIWFRNDAGRVGADPFLWVGSDSFLVWFQLQVEPTFLFDYKVKVGWSYTISCLFRDEG